MSNRKKKIACDETENSKTNWKDLIEKYVDPIQCVGLETDFLFDHEGDQTTEKSLLDTGGYRITKAMNFYRQPKRDENFLRNILEKCPNLKNDANIKKKTNVIALGTLDIYEGEYIVLKKLKILPHNLIKNFCVILREKQRKYEKVDDNQKKICRGFEKKKLRVYKSKDESLNSSSSSAKYQSEDESYQPVVDLSFLTSSEESDQSDNESVESDKSNTETATIDIRQGSLSAEHKKDYNGFNYVIKHTGGKKGWGLFANQEIAADTILIGGDSWTKTFSLETHLNEIPCEFGTVVARIETKTKDTDKKKHKDAINEKIKTLSHKKYILTTQSFLYTRNRTSYAVAYVIDPYNSIFGFINEPDKKSNANVIVTDNIKMYGDNEYCLNIIITTLKDIEKGEEIQWYYGKNYPRKYGVD